MKHNKWFCPGLYFEGLRRLRLVGILYMIVLLLESIFVPLMARVNSNPSFSSSPAEVVSGMDLQPALLMLITVGVPIMVLVLFAFYRSRAGSDFWHALPQTRLCQYVSLWAALLTWIVALILIPTAVSCGVSMLCAEAVAPLWGSVFQYAACVFAGCVLSAALATVAVTLTGTIFSSLVLYALILFLPRILILLVSQAVTSVLPIVPISAVLPFAQDWNLAVSAWTNGSLLATVMMGTGNAYVNMSGLWYSLVLAVLATAAGGWLFCKRKSEAAQRSAPSRFLQALYRLLLAITMFCPISISVYTEVAQFGTFSEPVLVLFLFFLAIVVLLAYELITTKRWRNLLRVLPTVGIALVLNAMLIGALSVNSRLTLQFEPKANEIKSVSILNENDFTQGRYASDFSQYAMYTIRDEAFTDEELTQLVATRLAADNEALRNGTYLQDRSQYYDADAYAYQTYTFRIVTNDGVRYRTLRIPLSSESVIGDLLAKNEKYRETWLSLPPALPNTVTTQGGYVNLVDAQYAQVLNSMREELQAVSFEDWFRIVNHPYENAIEIFVCSFEQDGLAFRAELPLNATLMPKSTELFFKCYWDANRTGVESILDGCRFDGDMKDYNRMVEVTVNRPETSGMKDMYTVMFDLSNGKTANAELYDDFVKALRAEPIGIGDRYVTVSIVPYSDNEKILKNEACDTEFGYPFYVKIDDPDGSLTERLIEAATAH